MPRFFKSRMMLSPRTVSCNPGAAAGSAMINRLDAKAAILAMNTHGRRPNMLWIGWSQLDIDRRGRQGQRCPVDNASACGQASPFRVQ
jgi:hypothetical protein